MDKTKFEDLLLEKPLVKLIGTHFKQPTSIQVKTIPSILEDKDVIASSKTGSGKTLAFAAGTIQKVEPDFGMQALVLVPTRELVEQVADVFKTFSEYKGLNVATVYGGVSFNKQVKSLEDADIVVGTPGRVLEHTKTKSIYLQRITTLILDEADVMAKLGFFPTIKKIMKHLPKKIQTLLFSATQSKEIKKLAGEYMKNPVSIAAKEKVDTSKLEQIYYEVTTKQKLSLLTHLLQQEQSKLVIVFCNTKNNVDFVSKNLKLSGLDVYSFHSGVDQKQRNKIIRDFNKGKKTIVVGTNVLARGLDVEEISHIYNYDSPFDPRFYIHRIGRTARAGKEGKAISLVAERDKDHFKKVIEVNKVEIRKKTLPKFEFIKTDYKIKRDYKKKNRN
ncbi:DEAD/DEAH box helicase [archaeon]|jgi:ATP-dependent RNA helicase DeaD|nr:DEAD/DEAH box helicase [archaeon]MBT6823966.1 DEAD/DEAH box helicase [archaeon]MBT7107196.1 DEAD/DEAH box helicase [archaeon]MBT7297734.1 DEAD/DEAH box helicase [archaeon]